MRMKNMSSVDFDRKIARFYRLWEGMKLVSKNRVVEFLDIDTSHLVTAIQTQVWHAHEQNDKLGDFRKLLNITRFIRHDFNIVDFF